MDQRSPSRLVRVSGPIDRTRSSRRAGVPRKRSIISGYTSTGNVKEKVRSPHFSFSDIDVGQTFLSCLYNGAFSIAFPVGAHLRVRQAPGRTHRSAPTHSFRVAE